MLPRFRPAAFGLFALIWFVSMLLGDRPWATALALDPDGFARAQGLWQPLSAMFLQPVGRGALLATLLVLWICASPLEGFWGPRRYLVMVLVAGFVGYVGTGLLALGVPAIATAPPFGSALPVELATVVAFGFVFSDTPYRPFGMEKPIRGRLVALVLAALLVAMPFINGQLWTPLVPALISSLVAVLFVTQPWRRQGKSGKIDAKKPRDRPSHLRLVHSAEDMLN